MPPALDPITQHHVDQAADRLAEEFVGVFSQETIARYLAESLDMLEGARINVFVPVLAHRFARERLNALAQAKGIVANHQQDGRGSGQVVLAGKDPCANRSCTPAEEIDPTGVEAMIAMGCGDACPIYPGKPYDDWVIDDLPASTSTQFRRIREEIDRRVHNLLSELLPPAPARALNITFSEVGA